MDGLFACHVVVEGGFEFYGWVYHLGVNSIRHDYITCFTILFNLIEIWNERVTGVQLSRIEG